MVHRWTPVFRGARLCFQKAQNGDRSSQVLLWLAYSGGHGVPKDAKQGVPYLRQAAEQGSIEGQWVLSTLYEFGRAGLPVDHAESFKWALKAAQRGHMVAQHNVATAYFHGRGVEENLEQARYWYGRAAEQGFAHSEWMMGHIYYEGLGVPANRDEAVKWLSKSLAQGHVPTMLTLAEMYTNTSHVPLQPQFVFDLERGAAQGGSHAAEFEVGRIYREGYLGAPDYAQAMVWFNQAAAAGYGPAINISARCTNSGREYRLTLRRRAAITNAPHNSVFPVPFRRWVNFTAMARACPSIQSVPTCGFRLAQRWVQRRARTRWLL